MTWETVFDGVVMGDHITVEWYVDGEDDGEYLVKVTATSKEPPVITLPIVEPGSIMFPLPPDSTSKRSTYEYESIDKMYENFAKDTGRKSEFTDELEKAIQNQ